MKDKIEIQIKTRKKMAERKTMKGVKVVTNDKEGRKKIT